MEQLQYCPVCHHGTSSIALSPTDHTVTLETFDIRQCDACGFHFTSPRPEQNRIGSYYLSENYISHSDQVKSLKDRIYRTVRLRAIRGKRRLISNYCASGRVLDVGCGTGTFLHHLQQNGYQTQGVEVSEAARAIAQGLQLSVAETLEAIPATAQFDVLTLWHVLEHVPDPAQTLRDLHARCAPNGHLVIAVPDRSSWDCRHYGPLWAAWDVPRHLSHFRRQDIKRLLADAGFDLVEIRNMWYDAPYVAMLSEQYEGAGPLAAFLKGAGVGLYSNLIAWLKNSPTSSSLFVARKAK